MPLLTLRTSDQSFLNISWHHPSGRQTLLMDTERIITKIRQTLGPDPLAQKHLGSTEDPKWQTNPDSLLLFDGRIYVPEIQDLRLQVLQFKHDHILSGHFGINKTFELVRRDFNWPGMRSYIKDYCKSCTTCMRSKPQRHKPYGLLKQLPVPEKPWNSISMDFIEQLPASSEFTAMLVIVDRFSKQGIFIPTTDTITSPKLAELFVLHVFSKHGIPPHVTSDRGSEFVSHFWRSLGKALDMKLHYTSGYHPEGDGQTECTNQTLEQYLRVYCNYQQDNWASLLPLAEFAYNNAPSATTGISPFFANKGYHPNLAENLKSPRFWTPKLIIDARHASCFIWYGGQVMKAQMKKPRGSSQPRLTTRLSSFKTFTSLTQLSPDHYPLSECLIIYALKSLLKKKKEENQTHL